MSGRLSSAGIEGAICQRPEQEKQGGLVEPGVTGECGRVGCTVKGQIAVKGESRKRW